MKAGERNILAAWHPLAPPGITLINQNSTPGWHTARHDPSLSRYHCRSAQLSLEQMRLQCAASLPLGSRVAVVAIAANLSPTCIATVTASWDLGNSLNH